MKRVFFFLASASLIISCNQTTKVNETVDSTNLVDQPSKGTELVNIPEVTFDINKIPFSTADIGDFPFINLPKGLKEMNKPTLREFDICFFPVDGIMTSFEGKLYKTFVSAESGEVYSQHFFEKSMADYLESISAVKVFDGEITKEEYERYHKQDPNKGGEGDMGYAGQNMKFWVIRTKDKGNIYIQYLSNNASGSLNVLQEAVLEQTITKVTSDQIVSDLTERGKSILYINFDLDKSNITTDGLEIVGQIAEALKTDKSLKISIEGHTDNTGDSNHNKKLSTNRAEAVLQQLISDGVDKSRLKAMGFGAERPLLANDSEDNKAKNRRVELVRVK